MVGAGSRHAVFRGLVLALRSGAPPGAFSPALSRYRGRGSTRVPASPVCLIKLAESDLRIVGFNRLQVH